MGVIDDLLDAAQRFAHWKAVQDQTRSAATEAAMSLKRQAFRDTRFVAPDSNVFFESVIEGDDLMPTRYFEYGQKACKPVGRIRISLGANQGEGYATGFLVAPGLLLTNQHVLRDLEWARAATIGFDAEDDLQGLPKTVATFTLQPNDLYLASEELDYCLVRVSPVSLEGRHIEEFGYFRLIDKTGKIERDEYATIIQHPHGRQKQVALRNNKIIVYVYDTESNAAQNNYLYYGTDTLAGSSGSPVLSDQWFVVALHRRGVPATRTVGSGQGTRKVVLTVTGRKADEDEPLGRIKYIANEGVRVSKILADLKIRAASDTGASGAARALREISDVAGDPDKGPLWVPVAVPVATSRDMAVDDGAGLLEIVRRKTAVFADAPGYREDFLGVKVALPEPSQALAKQLAKRIDDPSNYLLPFNHFTTAVHARRRMPVFAAVNIDGTWKAQHPEPMPKRPAWSYDPRLSDEHQMNDSLFSNMLQRGHMAARDYVYWGDDVEIADVHSFTLSNVCPQIGKFNGNREWARLERLIVGTAASKARLLSVFCGPIFAKSDKLYDDLRSKKSDAAFDTGIRIPARFWYIVIWKEGGAPKARYFILDQSDDIDEVGPLELDFEAPATVKDSTREEITRLTDLDFPDLT